MPQMSEWLKVMLGEISRKREDADRAREEEMRRQQEGGTRGGAQAPPADTRRASVA